nr:MAG TPA: hypothetical protein [Crassvirales sp.]
MIFRSFKTFCCYVCKITGPISKLVFCYSVVSILTPSRVFIINY